MEEIIAPIDKEVLKSELTQERRLRFTNKSHNEIYVVTAHNAPNVMKEIGRLLGLPEVLVDKVPIDGLCGKTDEENLGFTYAELDVYIRTGKIDDLQKKELIDRKHKANLFKLQLMPSFMPEI